MNQVKALTDSMWHHTLTPLLEKPSRALLTLHIHPDPDSVASNLFLADMLKELGHDVDIVSTDKIPASLSYLKGFDTMRHVEDKQIDWTRYDIFWALDMSSNDRHGIITPLPEHLTTVVIDHHISNQGWGSVNLVDTEELYPSTCSMLFEIAHMLDITITRERAAMLLTGIAGDTGFFMYGLTPKVLRDAAELLDAGADYELIKKEIIGSMDMAELEFISKALERAELYNNVVIIAIPHEIWRTYGKAQHKNEFIVYYLSRIQDSKAGVLLIEEEPNTIRFEFRSRDLNVNVAEKAKILGGGGHKNAAGAMMKNITLVEAVNRIKELF